jgi:hypothetical protein
MLPLFNSGIKHLLYILSISLFCFIYIIIISSQFGLGVSPDSVAYLAGAQSILDGKGYTNNGSFINQWPPLYSITIAFVSKITNTGILFSAKLLSAFMYFLTIIVINQIISKYKISLLSNILINFFLITSTAFTIFLWAWSESLFIFFLMVSILIFLKWLESEKNYLLFIIGIITGLMLLTRFASLGFIGGFILFILFRKKNDINEKLKNIMNIVLPALLIFSLWMIYSSQNSFKPMNRDILFHPISAEHIISLIVTTLIWICPIINYEIVISLTKFIGTEYLRLSMIISIIIFTLFIVFISKRTFQYLSNIIKDEGNKFLVFLIFSYLIGLFVSITFFDYMINFENRLLSPIYPLIIVLLIPFFTKIEKLKHKNILILLSLIFFIFSYSFQFCKYSYSFINEGGGYSGKKWVDSETMNYLKNLDFRGNIICNKNDLLQFIFKKNNHILWLPRKINDFNQTENKKFEIEMNAFQDSLESGNSIIVYFDNVTWMYPPAKDYLLNKFFKFKIIKFNDGIVIKR